MKSKQKAPKIGVSKPILILTVLSVMGCMLSGISDLSWYTGIEAYVTDGFEEGSPAIKVYEKFIPKWTEAGIDTSTTGLMQLKQLFLVVGLLNIPVLLGVALMFFKVRIGFEIYTISQVAYMLVPIYFLGTNFYPVFRTLHYGDIAIMVLFIIMWGIQRKTFKTNEHA